MAFTVGQKLLVEVEVVDVRNRSKIAVRVGDGVAHVDGRELERLAIRVEAPSRDEVLEAVQRAPRPQPIDIPPWASIASEPAPAPAPEAQP